MVESRKEKKTKNGVARCHKVYIEYSFITIIIIIIIIIIVSSFLAWISPE